MSDVYAPFALHNVFFVRSVVQAIREFNPEEGSFAEPMNHVEVQPDQANANFFIASMRTQVNPDKDPAHPYHIDMECVCGLQQIDTTMDEETARRGAMITAHSVLYGAIREAVSTITSRQPWGSLVLGLSILSGPKKNSDERASQMPKD